MKFFVIFLFVNSYIYGMDECSNVPDETSYFDFKSACRRHDVCYIESKIYKRKRILCDQLFKKDMKSLCGRYDFACNAAHYTYYRGVRSFGAKSFERVRITEEENGKNGSATRLLMRLEQEDKSSDVRKNVEARLEEQVKWLDIIERCGKTKRKSQKKFISDKAKKSLNKEYKKCEKEVISWQVRDIPWKKPHHKGSNWRYYWKEK